MLRYRFKLLIYKYYFFNVFNNALSLKNNIPYYVHRLIAKIKCKNSTNKKISHGIFSPKQHLGESGLADVRDLVPGQKANECSGSLTKLLKIEVERFEQFFKYHSRLKNPCNKLDFDLSKSMGHVQLREQIVAVLGCLFEVVWIDVLRANPIKYHVRQQSWPLQSHNTNGPYPPQPWKVQV